MNPYFHKIYLKNVIRVNPPRDQQEVDNRIRLHRAEWLHPFSNEFFNDFIKNINQQDIRCYPNVHELKDRLEAYKSQKEATINVKTKADIPSNLKDDDVVNVGGMDM